MPEMMQPKPLEAVKICENTYRIEDDFVRCLLFIGEEKALLIDAGFGVTNSLRKLVESFTDKPIQLALTHADPDHIGFANEFEKVYMHKDEVARYKTMEKPDGPEICTFEEGDIFDIGGRCFEVILFPGHTWGSVAFFDRANKVMVTGDLLTTLPVFMFGEDRNLDAYIASLEKLLSMKDEVEVIYAGHGECPLSCALAEKLLVAAKKMRAGELEAMDPPFPFPAKMYMFDGVGFYY